MRLTALCSVLAAVLACAPAARAAVPPSGPGEPASADPFRWLEDVDGARALAWVKAHDARTAGVLEGDPRFETFRREALALFTAEDRIPTPRFLGGGVSNLWQDAANPKGLWRTTTLEGYRAAAPPWTTLIDVDALGKAEGRNWIFKGANCLQPEERLCLVSLSDGGKDAVSLREFDVTARAFVPPGRGGGGYAFGEDKQTVDWLDRDTLVAARDWDGTGATLTASGYPFVVKVIKRGQPASAAREVFRGRPTDTRAEPIVLRDPDGRVRGLVVERAVTFFESEFSLIGDKGSVRLPLPAKTTLGPLVSGQLTFRVREDWRGFKAGAVLSYDLDALARDPASARPMPVFQPTERQAVQDFDGTRSRVVVNYLDEVKGKAASFAYEGGAWRATPLELPRGASLDLGDASLRDDRLFVTSQGFLTPPTLWLADAATGRAEAVKRLPDRFDASRDVVEQAFAPSADGTPIPYFVVRPKDLRLDGTAPVQMFGYGGFELAETPVYRPELGKLWLERGGVYVLANIRGGGEFGPRWHEAALREHRQRAFDDFAAVARDLIARKLTSPAHLGIYGRSNGGVLTTVSMTQHPELYGAVVVESPLVDMLRYTHLPAGASWAGEYGDPDVAADRAFIAQYSGYQALKPGVRYPKPYVTTNTKDDRVHPGHARKFTAKLESLGDPVLYFENTFGGHANDADPELNARRWARHYVYLSQQLMDAHP